MVSERAIRRTLVAGLVVASAVFALAAEPPATRLAALDGDGNKRLTLDEFLKSPGKKDVLRRDFELFDGNDDQRLSAEELDAIPLGRPASQRGTMPDPLAAMLDQAMAQVDENFDHWDQNPNKQVAVNGFVQSFVLSFPDPNRVTSHFAQLRQDADENKDGRVNHAEARRFLEIQLGLRSGDGELLRLPSGQVMPYGKFLAVDSNKDRVMDRAEFHAFWPQRDKLDEQWKLLDADRDDRITWAEYVNSNGFGMEDPIEQFRLWDTNLDAHVDEKELLAGTPPDLQQLAKQVFPGFDSGGDRKLTLWEFRQLPQANLVLPWNETVKDADRNGVLQFQEFTFGDGRFPLLRLIYFTRFDVNSSGFLEPKEFPFSVHPPEAFYRLNADGTGWQKIFSSDEYPSIGSPKISADGKWVVFDAIPRGQNDNSARKMLLMTIDGENVREVGGGMMPTWSRDGTKIAFSFSGVQVMDLETKDVRSLVPNGWSAQWSPDGAKIAFTQGKGLSTMDVATEQVAVVLNDAQSPYEQIYWNIAWSPDNSRICFKGVRQGQAEIASVRVADPPDLKVHYSGRRQFLNHLSWSPDGKRIVFAMQADQSPRLVLHELDPTRDGEPMLLKGPDPSLQSYSSCWHPDGTFLIMHTRHDD